MKFQTTPAVIPKRLDQVINDCRETTSLGLASADELAATARAIIVPDGQPIKAHVSNWRLVSYRAAWPTGNFYTLLMHLLGDIYVRDGGPHPWITSHLAAVDLGNRVAITHTGSFYRLDGKPGIGEPTEPQLMQLCKGFHAWGRGRPLGIASV